jgi:hypothetical protein
MEMLRLPHFIDSWLTDGIEVSLMRQPPFIPKKIPVLISVAVWFIPRAIL